MANFFTRRRRNRDADALYTVWFAVVPGSLDSSDVSSGGTSSGAPALVARQSAAARTMTAAELEGMQAEQREAVFDFIIERGLIFDEYWVIEGIDRIGGRDGVGSYRAAPVRLALDGAETPEQCERVLREFERRDRADDTLQMVTAAVATEQGGERDPSSPLEDEHVLQLGVTAGEEDFDVYVEITATTGVASDDTGPDNSQVERERACQDLRSRVWGWIAANRILDDGYQVDEAAYQRSNPSGGFGDRSTWTPDASTDVERITEIRGLVTVPGALEWSADKLRTQDPQGRKAERTLKTKIEGYEPGVVIM
jgi:hypothetical protein